MRRWEGDGKKEVEDSDNEQEQVDLDMENGVMGGRAVLMLWYAEDSIKAAAVVLPCGIGGC